MGMRILNRLFCGVIRFYQIGISPFLGAHCRFTPTCSEYSREAFERFPFFYALWLTIRRISRCHPFHPGGFDPLPGERK